LLRIYSVIRDDNNSVTVVCLAVLLFFTMQVPDFVMGLGLD